MIFNFAGPVYEPGTVLPIGCDLVKCQDCGSLFVIGPMMVGTLRLAKARGTYDKVMRKCKPCLDARLKLLGDARVVIVQETI